MSVNHTPGPWRIGKIGSIVTDCPPGCTGDKESEEFYGGHFVCESVSGADAQLISAAPDLLAACIEVEGLFSPSAWEGIRGPSGAATIHQLRAALRKARGEE